MNRSALCIKMLQILNAHESVTKQELAARLETNPRNIAEFKKELETAGYVIESTKGKYASYHLAEHARIPAITFTPQEMDAINEAVYYLEQHKDFLSFERFNEAIEKVKANLAFVQDTTNIYVKTSTPQMNDSLHQFILLARKAEKEKKVIQFDYRSLRSKKYEVVELQPYEILNINGNYYCLGYNHQKKDFRTYKFSTLRLKNLRITNKSFIRDNDFNVNLYLGKSGLMKKETIEIECKITGYPATLIYEKGIGVHPQMEWLDSDTLYVKTMIEGKVIAMELLGSLGSHCELIAPLELKQAMHEEIKKMLEKY